jgi:chromosome segregation ATPase
LRDVIRNTTNELKDTAKNLHAARTALSNSEKTRAEEVAKTTKLQDQVNAAISQLSALHTQVNTLESSKEALLTKLEEEKSRADAAMAAAQVANAAQTTLVGFFCALCFPCVTVCVCVYVFVCVCLFACLCVLVDV